MRRPSVAYSDMIADHICAQLSRGRTVKDICAEPGMPSARTVNQWVRENRGGFGDRYKAFSLSRGVPLLYSYALSERICDELSTGRPLSKICSAPGMPSADAVLGWVRADRDGFAARYWDAREWGCEALMDEMKEIAYDDSNDVIVRSDGTRVSNPVNVARARQKIMMLRWLLSKIMPRQLGRKPAAEPAPRSVDDITFPEVMRMIDGRSRGLPNQRSADRDRAQLDAAVAALCRGLPPREGG